MKKNYGSKNWSKAWVHLEQTGNIGIDYCINPVLYPKMCDHVSMTDDAHLVDFGAGTNLLAIQFLYGNEANVPALQLCRELDNARDNIRKFTGIEQSAMLVHEAEKYHQRLGCPEQVEVQQMHLVNGNKLPFEKGSLDLAVSRNFLMHLGVEDLSYHFDEVAQALKDKGKYIFAVLNPEYEQRKYINGNSGRSLKNGERYSFAHGSAGENGNFYHYYKNIEQYETVFGKHFDVVDKKACRPINDRFKYTHERYYWEDCPMSFVYELQKRNVHLQYTESASRIHAA